MALAWRDRIVELTRLPARDLQSHDGNWRTHPQFQQDALLGTLQEVGIAGALLVYHSPAHDGALVTIDGHLRKDLNPDQEWPCLVLDVTDDEASYILATHDPLAALAEANHEALSRLLEQVHSDDEAVQELFHQLAIRQNMPEPPADAETAFTPVAEQWLVAITCQDEAEQVTTLETLTAQGYVCRALIS